MTVMVGLVATPILWIWGMIDAYKSAKNINVNFGAQND